MKTNKYTKYMAAVLLTGAPMLWSACTDDWNEHYQEIPGVMSGETSLLTKIKEDPNLANFYKVLTAIGAAESLDTPQQLTVWAPKGMTDEQADSVIAVYESDVKDNIKWKDNRAIKQFFQNHVALYARPISALTDSTIHMMNRKYMKLIGEDTSKGTLDGLSFSDMQLCNNGILYKAEHMQQFFPNIREYTELNGLDSVANFFKDYDEYTLDEQSSVEGGIIDGNTVYLDSVTTRYNRMLSTFDARIESEDSSYIFVAPTNEVWEKEFEKYSKYYQYATGVNRADSLSKIQTQRHIIYPRFFNMSKYSRHNQHIADSLTNTYYSYYQTHYPRTDVFYNAETELLGGLEKVKCSNGYVYLDNKGVIDPKSTFFNRRDLSATNSSIYEVLTKKEGGEEVPAMSDDRSTWYEPSEIEWKDTLIVEDNGDTLTWQVGHVLSYREYYYVEFKAKDQSEHTNVTYTLPNTLSNMYYNIYVVSIPGRGRDTNIKDYLSSYFTVECKAQDVNGKTQNCGSDAAGNRTTANAFLMNSNTYDETDVMFEYNYTGYADVKKTSGFDRAYVTKAEEIDTILIAKAKMFDVSSAGLDKGVVTLTFKSFGPGASKTKEKVYTRNLRFNELILIPFETKEEAEAAAFDLDAFNDRILMRNRKQESTKE